MHIKARQLNELHLKIRDSNTEIPIKSLKESSDLLSKTSKNNKAL